MNGLVLAGGRSHRMKRDKALLDYHDMPQYRYIYDMIRPFCEATYVSYPTNLDVETISDKMEYQHSGPMAGILSAMEHTLTDWLVVAVDYPLIESEDIDYLVHSSELHPHASVMFNMETLFFEPYIGVYKKSIYSQLKHSFEVGEYSMQKLLQTINAFKVILPDNSRLKNVNTEEEYEQIKRIIK